MRHLRRWAFLAPLVLVAALACGSPQSLEVAAGATEPAPVDAVGLPLGDAEREASMKLAELARVRDHHARLIASIPTPTSEPGAFAVGDSGEPEPERVVAWASGYPVPAPADEYWFDPAEGLSFFRLEGGDWTNRRLRSAHSHRHLFYRSDYPEGIPSFASGTIQRALAGRLAFGAAEFMPILGSPTPDVVDLFYRRLGWEIRDADGPVVNVWTAYDYYDGDVVQSFAVGGVMVMQVKTTVRTGSEVHYLEPGHWLGSVVVERLR